MIWSCLVGFLLSFATVVATTWTALRVLRSRVLRRTLRQRHCPAPLAERHRKKVAIPAIGGIFLLLGQVVVFVHSMKKGELASWLLLLTALQFGFLGLWDDLAKLRSRASGRAAADSPVGRDLSARSKFCVQALLALALTAPLLTPFRDGVGESRQQLARSEEESSPPSRLSEAIQSSKALAPPATSQSSIDRVSRKLTVNFYRPGSALPAVTLQGWQVLIASAFFAFVVVGSSNAVNLTDGLDGLAAGCSLCVSATLAIGAIVSADPRLAAAVGAPHTPAAAQVALYLSGVAGGLVAFLPFNRHPAQIFMGDVGSLSLGAIFGLSALLICQEWALAASSIVFIAETLSVILQVLSCRLRGGRRLFLCSPLHHHFECLGWSEQRIVGSFWLCALISSLVTLSIFTCGGA